MPTFGSPISIPVLDKGAKQEKKDLDNESFWGDEDSEAKLAQDIFAHRKEIIPRRTTESLGWDVAAVLLIALGVAALFYVINFLG